MTFISIFIAFHQVLPMKYTQNESVMFIILGTHSTREHEQYFSFVIYHNK